MIKEGTGLSTAGHGAVIPYTGKCAAKTPDVSGRTDAGSARAGRAAAVAEPGKAAGRWN